MKRKYKLLLFFIGSLLSISAIFGIGYGVWVNTRTGKVEANDKSNKTTTESTDNNYGEADDGVEIEVTRHENFILHQKFKWKILFGQFIPCV